MKKDRITPGIILVLIGIAVLLRNFGYLHFHWTNFLYLWPLFLVIGGINLLFANNHTPWARAIKLIVIIGCIGLLMFADFGNRFRFLPHIYFNGKNFHTHHENDDDIDMDFDDSDSTSRGLVKVDGNSFYHVAWGNTTKVAKLNLNGGATTYLLSDTTNQLFAANVKEYYGHYRLNNHTDDSVTTVDFEMKGDHKGNFRWDSDENKSNKATLKLNVNPLWDMDVTAGATDLNFDLSKFKIRNFNLHGGAAAFSVKLGQPVEGNSHVEVASGVSDITISIPKNVACRVESSTGLSSNTFEGFNKTEDNHYETPGFASAKNHITINISGGLSDFKVKRY